MILFMKGIPNQPAAASREHRGALNALGVQYAALDILPDPRIREELSGLSGWPTIPQLFVDGELVVRSDIVWRCSSPASSPSCSEPSRPMSPSSRAPAEPVQRGIGLENRLN